MALLEEEGGDAYHGGPAPDGWVADRAPEPRNGRRIVSRREVGDRRLRARARTTQLVPTGLGQPIRLPPFGRAPPGIGDLASRRQADRLCRHRVRARAADLRTGDPVRRTAPDHPRGLLHSRHDPHRFARRPIRVRREPERRLDVDLSDRRGPAAPARHDGCQTRSAASLDRGWSRPLHPELEDSAVPAFAPRPRIRRARRRGSRSRPPTPRAPRTRPMCASRPTARRASTPSRASSRRSTSWTGSGSHALRPRLGRAAAVDVPRRRAGGHHRALFLGVEARQGEADRRGRRRARARAQAAGSAGSRPSTASSSDCPSASRRRAASCSSSCSPASSSRFSRPTFEQPRGEGRERRPQRRPRTAWTSTAASSAPPAALLTLLLGMELVDKINFRDELELARALQASLIPKDLPKTALVRDRRAQRDREHGRRRHLRLRAAAGRAAGRPLRRRLGARHGRGPRHGRGARRVPHAARRGSVAGGDVRDVEPHPLPHGQPARVLRLRLPDVLCPTARSRPRSPATRSRSRSAPTAPSGSASARARIRSGSRRRRRGPSSRGASTSASCCC